MSKSITLSYNRYSQVVEALVKQSNELAFTDTTKSIELKNTAEDIQTQLGWVGVTNFK
ncbi:hypothetical protein D3C76_169690 [compost metagenome]